jgi:hypothetical protein
MAAGAERGGRLIFGLNRGQFESYAFQYVLVHLCLNNHTSNTQHTHSHHAYNVEEEEHVSSASLYLDKKKDEERFFTPC